MWTECLPVVSCHEYTTNIYMLALLVIKQHFNFHLMLKLVGLICHVLLSVVVLCIGYMPDLQCTMHNNIVH